MCSLSLCHIEPFTHRHTHAHARAHAHTRTLSYPDVRAVPHPAPPTTGGDPQGTRELSPPHPALGGVGVGWGSRRPETLWGELALDVRGKWGVGLSKVLSREGVPLGFPDPQRLAAQRR